MESKAASDAEQYLGAKQKNKSAQDEVAQADFASKKWVWVVDKDEGYIAGTITQEKGEEVNVNLNNGKVSEVSKYTLRNACMIRSSSGDVNWLFIDR